MARKSSKTKNVTPSQKPYGTVTGLSKPTRNGSKFTTKWTVPKPATDKTRKDQWETQMATWTFTQSIGGKKYTKSTVVSDSVAKKKAKKIAYTRIDKKGPTSYLKTNSKDYQSFLRSYNKVLYVTAYGNITYKYNIRTIKKGKVNPKTKKKVKKNTVIWDVARGGAAQTGQKIVKCMRIPLGTKTLPQTVDFSKYHPYVPNRYLKSVTVAIQGVNRKGTGSARTSSAYTFKAPKAPTISGVTFNTDEGGNGVVSAKIDAKSAGVYHRSRTCYMVERWDNFSATYKKAYQAINGKQYSNQETINPSTDVADFASINYDQWISIRFRAFNQGCMGNSKEAPAKAYTISYPSEGVIKAVDVKNDQPYKWNPDTKQFEPLAMNDHNGIIIVSIGFVNTTNHPVDKVELWRLKSKADTAAKAGAIATQDGWEKIKEDNGKCSAMQDTIADAYPATGVHVWYRLVTHHGPFTRTGPAMEAAALFHGPSKISFINARTVDDGNTPTAIEVTYGFEADNADGTQLEWSEFMNALHSNHPPETYDDIYVLGTEDAKEIMTKYGVSGYEYVSQFYITDLETGGKYYLSGARFTDDDVGRVLGDRTFWVDIGTNAVAPILFGMKPSNVILTAPPAVSPDSTFEISWTFDSEFEQTAYTLYYVNADGATALRPKTPGSQMSTLLTLDEINLAKYRNTENGAYEIQLRVEVETSGLSATSSNTLTTISSAPDCQISWPDETSVLTKQPMSFNYRCTQNGHLIIVVTAEGITGEYIPGVEYVQASGDSVWTGSLDVVANLSDEEPATFTLPSNLEFHHNGKYTIQAYLRNTTTGLESDIRTVNFSVDWSRTAEPPSELSTVELVEGTKSVKIIPRRPSNFDEDNPDVCDIYRITPDGTYLIKSNASFGAAYYDHFAPYSKTAILRYGLVTKTPDGDTAYREIGYGLKGYAIRFEWDVDDKTKRPRNVLEVPYNLRIGDSYEKDFERQRRLDGTIVGLWNEGVQRNGNLQTDLIKLSDPEQKELVRHLARYAGPVFVRTPDGCAYVADVQVSSFQTDYDTLVIPVTFDAKEIDLIEAFTAIETSG